MARRRRDPGWPRLAAPVAFLAAVTIAVLLIRAGIHSNGTTTTASTQTSAASSGSHPASAHKRQPKLFYTVRSGDTFGSIASRYGISVAALEQLNPGVSSNSLAVGQKIRVK